jgi:hypothetical protein
MIIVKYETEEEADQIKIDKIGLGYILVEVSNITEGNFLGFQESGYVPPVQEQPLIAQVAELKSQNADIIFALVSNNLM